MKLSEEINESLERLGWHIQYLREEKNISIKEVSERTGIRKEYLKRIEKGCAYGVLVNTHLLKIAKAIDVELSLFFNFE